MCGGKTCPIRFHHVAQQVLHTFFLGVSQFVEVVSESVPFTPGGSCTRYKVEWLQLTGRCRRTIHLIIYKREQNYIDRSQEKKWKEKYFCFVLGPQFSHILPSKRGSGAAIFRDQTDFFTFPKHHFDPILRKNSVPQANFWKKDKNDVLKHFLENFKQ